MYEGGKGNERTKNAIGIYLFIHLSSGLVLISYSETCVHDHLYWAVTWPLTVNTWLSDMYMHMPIVSWPVLRSHLIS